MGFIKTVAARKLGITYEKWQVLDANYVVPCSQEPLVIEGAREKPRATKHRSIASLPIVKQYVKRAWNTERCWSQTTPDELKQQFVSALLYAIYKQRKKPKSPKKQKKQKSQQDNHADAEDTDSAQSSPPLVSQTVKTENGEEDNFDIDFYDLRSMSGSEQSFRAIAEPAAAATARRTTDTPIETELTAGTDQPGQRHTTSMDKFSASRDADTPTIALSEVAASTIDFTDITLSIARQNSTHQRALIALVDIADDTSTEQTMLRTLRWIRLRDELPPGLRRESENVEAVVLMEQKEDGIRSIIHNDKSLMRAVQSYRKSHPDDTEIPVRFSLEPLH